MPARPFLRVGDYPVLSGEPRCLAEPPHGSFICFFAASRAERPGCPRDGAWGGGGQVAAVSPRPPALCFRGGAVRMASPPTRSLVLVGGVLPCSLHGELL